MIGQLNQNMTIWVPGTPKPQPSKNAALLRGRPITVTPGTANDWKNRIQVCVGKAMRESGWKRVPRPLPVELELHWVFRRPKAHYRTNGQVKPNSPLMHTSRPDRDNLEKALLDPLTWSGVFDDDSQVVCGESSKWYHAQAEGVLIHLRAGEDMTLIVMPAIPGFELERVQPEHASALVMNFEGGGTRDGAYNPRHTTPSAFSD